jgi:hypothetical protein
MKTPLLGSLAAIGALFVAAAPASAAVVINEVESDDAVVVDFVEVMNTSAAPIDLGGYVIKDSDNGHAFTIPSPTMVAAGGYYVADVDSGPGGFGLGKDDSARLFAPADLVNPIDSFAWTSHAAATYGRCPNGTGPIVATASSTRGAANDCPLPAVAWPGSTDVADASDYDFGQNLSGLAYQPSGTAAPGVLWAVRNNPSTLFRLVWNGTKWTPDTASGWANGKQMLFPDGAGVPDAEGVTLAGGDPNGIFVSIERNDSGAFANTSRPGVLRYDLTAAGAALTATKEFNLTADLPGLDKNAGLEAITWVPDEVLVAKGLKDGAKAYNPADHPDHGNGLFFVGVEQTGQIIAYALNQTTGGYTRVATISSGFPKIMELSYEPESKLLWAVCDNECNGRTATLDVAASGSFEITKVYDRPAGMPNLNNEGFAFTPQAECVNGLKPVFYADDTNDNSIALRSGKRTCTPLPEAPKPTPTATPEPTPSAPQQPVTTAPTTKPAIAADTLAPRLAVALKLTKRGKLRATITLAEHADLTITATARKNARSKARTILTTTRKGTAAGKRTFTLAPKRKSLHRGQTITLTVKARDAAGNITTRKTTAKVK